MTLMRKEIFEQPEKFDVCLKRNAATANRIAQEVQKRGIRHIVAGARGSSSNACWYLKYLCEIYCGMTVSFVSPSVVSAYGGEPDMSGTLFLGVSQSGRAQDVLSALNLAKAQGTLTVSVTNNPDSPLAKASNEHIFLDCGEEKSVAATKTFTCQMLVMLMLCNAFSGNRLEKELKEARAAVEAALENDDAATKIAEQLFNARDCVVLTRGVSYGAALEGALKIQETTYINARPFAWSDFMHGPIAVLDETSTVILLSPGGKMEGEGNEVCEKIKNTGAKTMVLGKSGCVCDGCVMLAAPELSETVFAFYAVVIMQRAVEKLSLKKSLNPDAPRGLNKITVTK